MYIMAILQFQHFQHMVYYADRIIIKYLVYSVGPNTLHPDKVDKSI